MGMHSLSLVGVFINWKRNQQSERVLDYPYDRWLTLGDFSYLNNRTTR